jgi:putative ABC transport system permease protein
VIPLKAFLSRLSDVLLRRRRDERLSEEVGTHLELLTRDYIAKGLSPSDARAAARRAFGGVDQMTSAYRDQRGLPVLDALALDARLAVRLLGRDRGFTIVAVLVLGLGIGVNNMLFTILNAHTLRGLPIHRADRVVFVSTLDSRQTEGGVSYLDFQDLRAAVKRLSGLAAFTTAPIVLGEDATSDRRSPDRVEATYLTANVLDVIETTGTPMILGRALRADDDRPGAARVAMLSSHIWRSRYDADRDVLSRSILIDRVPTTIVGILPERPALPSTADVWLPLSAMPGLPSATRDVRVLRVLGRLQNDARLPDARAEIESIVNRLAREHVDSSAGVRARVVPINERYFGRPTDPAWLAFTAVGILVVLISCANVANLMLDRSLHRTRELAIRTSLGASRLRLVRQLLIEASLLAALGGTAGLGIAVGGVRAFRQAIPVNVLPYWFDYSMDARVVFALAVVSAATVLVFGLVPAFAASKTDPNQVLKVGGAIEGRSRSARWTSAFLTIELALTVVMLANLAVGLRIADPAPPAERAIRRRDIVTATVTLAGDRYRSAEARLEFHRRLRERLRAIPGTSAASIASALPLLGGVDRRLDRVAGTHFAAAAAPIVSSVAIGPGYFDALGLTLVKGREPGDAMDAAIDAEAVVNQRFADMYLAGQDPIGQRISLRAPASAPPASDQFTIVGVAPTLRQRLRAELEPIAYVPYRTAATPTTSVIVRNSTDTMALVPLLRNEVVALDANLPLYRVQTMQQVIQDVGWNGRLSSALLNVLAAIALGLSMVGLYAVTAHAASRRAREIGLRMALGAQPHQVRRLLLRRVLWQLSLGFLVGVASTAVWARFFSTGQAGVSVTDPRSLAIVAVVLVAVATLATLVPVRRATHIDPVVAIRND